MADDFFGQPIAKTHADELFKRYIEIKKRSLPKLKKALKNDPEALRYYCGRDGKDGVNEDWAFVFDKESLQRIMDKIEKLNASGVFIFHGARSAKDSVPKGKRKATDVDGAPTLMIFPTSRNEPKAKNDLEFILHHSSTNRQKNSLLANDGDDDDANGEQHPGTGGGSFTAESIVQLPQGFTKGQYRR